MSPGLFVALHNVDCSPPAASKLLENFFGVAILLRANWKPVEIGEGVG